MKHYAAWAVKRDAKIAADLKFDTHATLHVALDKPEVIMELIKARQTLGMRYVTYEQQLRIAKALDKLKISFLSP